MNREQLLQAISHYPALAQRNMGNTHKGTFGTLAIIGSSEGMSGAIVLAGKSALKAGCGKVFWALHSHNCHCLLLIVHPN